jgi:hypothetical protein
MARGARYHRARDTTERGYRRAVPVGECDRGERDAGARSPPGERARHRGRAMRGSRRVSLVLA